MTSRWSVMLTIVLMVWVSNAQALTIEQASRDVLQDVDELVASDVQHTLAIVEKYRQALSDNRLIYEEIVRHHQELADATSGLILFAAICRNDFLWPAMAETQHLTPEVQDAKVFYAYKLDRDAPARQRALEAKLHALAEHPIDSHLILFLPFTDDPLWALRHIERIAEKADGAAAEMLSWAFAVFCAVNRENQHIHQAAVVSPLVKRYGWRCD